VLAATLGVASRLSFSLASRQQVRSRYQQADVTLFTSRIEHEAFGLVPLEAMASGCPVIATGIGGSSEYCLAGVNCLRVPPANPAALAHAVHHLAQSRHLRQRLVEGGLRTASAFTLARQATGIEHSLLTASRSWGRAG
jgi:glycosyltransferase involved in cell wall biosynthesis